ncbi:MAG: class I SAM-dependent methyltransferase, partial [Blautia sp.]|nr:class I SAM-dependent methyltransferase [Blautia sp.]
VFRLVNNYLDPGGIFIFDMNTPYKYAELMGDAVIAENREDSSFIWENDYDPETGINEYALTLFLRRDDSLYEKEEELHTQRAWSEQTVRRLLEEAGMKVLAVTDAYTDKPVRADSQRLTYMVMEQGKHI